MSEILNILVADDQIQNQKAIEFLIDAWGYKSDIVSNGQEAFEKIATNSYDICLMDINMPVMDGKEATRTIRQKLKYLPIIALSGNHFERQECLQAGMDDFLDKPYVPEQLHDRILELTIKSITIQNNQDGIKIKRGMPMNQEHARELREIDKQGLLKINLKGIGSHDIIVHKNVPNKISQDFVGKCEEISVFLDRSPDRPGECHLYRFNFQMTTEYLIEEEYERKLKEEDTLLKDCSKLTTKKEK